MANKLSLPDFLEDYGDEDACWNHLRHARWGNTEFECPACGETEHWGLIKTRKLFECYQCGKQTSVTAGTILQDTKLPLTTWFLAAYLILTTKKGFSTLELARKTGVSDKTAWFLHHKITSVLGHAQAREMFGLVEADETHLGGKGPTKGGRAPNQELVMGIVECHENRCGRLRLYQIPETSRIVLHSRLAETVQSGSTVRTDGWQPYRRMEPLGFEHERISSLQTGTPGRQTPRIQMVFANLRSVMKGVHTQCSPVKLQSFLDLFAFRFNHRDDLATGLQTAVELWASSKPLTYQGIRCGGLN